MITLGIASAEAVMADTPFLSTDLITLDMEELMDLKVTSVSKQVQRLADAAAVFVLTQEGVRTNRRI